MQITTKGIVLHKIRYSESSIIVKILTKDAGVQSFIIKNAFSKKKKNMLALVENLSMIEITFDDKKQYLQYLKDVNLYRQYRIIPFDIVRKTLFSFYNELIYKLLREYQADEYLYGFIEKSLCELDKEEVVLADVHLHFMVHLSQVLGFLPSPNYSMQNRYFSIEESAFGSSFYENPLYLSAEASNYLWNIMQATPQSLPPKKIRQELLNGLIRYFEKHNEQIGKIESVEILTQILSEPN